MSQQVEKLYEKAQSSPNNFSFDELCILVEGAGYEFDRQKGTSHKIYKHPKIRDRYDAMVNIQNDHGRAKSYQVKIVLGLIDKYNLLEGRR